MEWGPKSAGWLFQVPDGPTPTDLSCSVLLEVSILILSWPGGILQVTDSGGITAGSHFQGFSEGPRARGFFPSCLTVFFGWCFLAFKISRNIRHLLSQFHRTRVPGPMFYVADQEELNREEQLEKEECVKQQVCLLFCFSSSVYLQGSFSSLPCKFKYRTSFWFLLAQNTSKFHSL